MRSAVVGRRFASTQGQEVSAPGSRILRGEVPLAPDACLYVSVVRDGLGRQPDSILGDLGSPFTPEQDRESQSHRAQDGRAQEGVPEPRKSKERIEGARDGQQDREPQGKAEALGGLDQPGREALCPGFRAGQAGDRERRKPDARAQGPDDAPG